MSRPKKTTVQIESMQKQILDTALCILQEQGPEAITSRAVAARLGVAHMSLYTYFENQAAILSALSQREMAKWRSQEQSFQKRAETEDIALVVKDLLSFYVTFASENPNLYRMAWVMPEAGLESLEENRQRTRNTVGNLAFLLKIGMEQSVFIKRDPFLAAAVVLAMVNTPSILFHNGRLVDPILRDRMIEETLTAGMLYLANPGDSAEGS